MILAFPYRIYPAWFGGDEAAMAELAHGSAKRMGWEVRDIRIVGSGFDRRGGHFVNFDVTYSDSVTQRSTQ